MQSSLSRRLLRRRLPAALALVLSAAAPGVMASAHAGTAGDRLLPGEMRTLADQAAAQETPRNEAHPARLASRTRTEKAPPSPNASTREMVRRLAVGHGIPPELAEAVVTIESRWNPRARSGGGAIGLMQIKYATARGMGYGGSVAGLYDPRTNATFGLAYLAGAHKLAGGDICGTILRYHAGHGAQSMGAATKRYCATAKKLMTAAGWKPGKAPAQGVIPAPATVATVEPGGFVRKSPAPAPTAASTTLARTEPGGFVRPQPAKADTARASAPAIARVGLEPDGAVIRPTARTAPAADTMIGSRTAPVHARKDGWVPPVPR